MIEATYTLLVALRILRDSQGILGSILGRKTPESSSLNAFGRDPPAISVDQTFECRRILVVLLTADQNGKMLARPVGISLGLNGLNKGPLWTRPLHLCHIL